MQVEPDSHCVAPVQVAPPHCCHLEAVALLATAVAVALTVVVFTEAFAVVVALVVVALAVVVAFTEVALAVVVAFTEVVLTVDVALAVEVVFTEDAAAAVAATPVCQPRSRESSYHQFRSIQPSKSVTLAAEPASMMKLVMPVGVQSGDKLAGNAPEGRECHRQPL